MSVDFLGKKVTVPDPYAELKGMRRRPIIYLGLGGVGSDTVSKIKTLYERTFRDLMTEGKPSPIPLGIQFLAFDSDINSRPENLSLNQEWHQMTAPNIGAVMDDLVNDPFYASWIPHISGHDFESGCGGFRALGRVLFSRNIDLFHHEFGRKRGAAMRYPLLDDPRPLVCVFASLAGGTGSGCLLDVCFYLRQTFPKAQIYGLLAVVDGSASGSERQRINATVGVYSALREIDAFMADNRHLDQHAIGETYTFPTSSAIHAKYDRPFDNCLLVGQSNARGTANLNNREKLSSYLSRVAFMMNAYSTDSGRGVRSFESDMNDRKGHVTGPHRGTAMRYLVPALGQLHIPTELAADYLQCRIAGRLLAFLSGGDPYPDAESERLFNTSGLAAHELVEALRRDGTGEPISSADFTGTIGRALRDEEYRYSRKGRDTILAHGESMVQGRKEAHKERMDDGARALLEAVKGNLHNAVSSVLNDARYRINGAIDLLDDLQRLLGHEAAFLSDSIAAAGLREVEIQWGSLRPLVLEVCTRGGVFNLDRLRIKRTVGLYAQFLNSSDVRVLDVATRERAADLIRAVANYIAGLRDDLEHLKLILGAAKAIVASESETLSISLYSEGLATGSNPDDICSRNLLDDQWRRVFLADDERLDDRALLAQMTQGDWHPMELTTLARAEDPAPQVAQRVCELVDQAVTAEVRRMSMTEAFQVRAQQDGAEPGKILGQMIGTLAQAQASLSDMRNRLSAAPETLTYVGGIDDELHGLLEAGPDYRELRRAKSYEKGKISYLEFHFPVALAGIDTLHSNFEPIYSMWRGGLRKVGNKANREIERKKFLCFAGSDAWQAPVYYERPASEEARLFAVAFAVSVVFTPERFPTGSPDQETLEGAIRALHATSRTPKEKRLGLFKIGRSDFWLTLPFDVDNPSNLKRPLKLGSTLQKARRALRHDTAVREAAEGWRRWWDENWSTFFTNRELKSALQVAVDAAGALHRGQASGTPDQAHWQETVQILESMRDGF